VTEDTTPI